MPKDLICSAYRRIIRTYSFSRIPNGADDVVSLVLITADERCYC